MMYQIPIKPTTVYKTKYILDDHLNSLMKSSNFNKTFKLFFYFQVRQSRIKQDLDQE